MRNAKLLTLSCLLTLMAAPVPASCEEFLLYAPKPASGEQVPTSPDQGVLVKKVTVKRGDTLSHLARKNIGTASYFPQVLLFNNIKNPNLIYAGDSLLIPVTPGHRASAKPSKKSSKGSKGKSRRHRHGARRSVLPAKQAAGLLNAERSVTSGEQEIYQRAKQAYLAGEYQQAQDLFSAFLNKFPNSRLAPDASLFQADCFLHLSGQ